MNTCCNGANILQIHLLIMNNTFAADESGRTSDFTSHKYNSIYSGCRCNSNEKKTGTYTGTKILLWFSLIYQRSVTSLKTQLARRQNVIYFMSIIQFTTVEFFFPRTQKENYIIIVRIGTGDCDCLHKNIFLRSALLMQCCRCQIRHQRRLQRFRSMFFWRIFRLFVYRPCRHK